MGITARQLAEILNLSPAAVSMALNDKPGVSPETRKKVKVAAEKYGYDFFRIQSKKNRNGSICFIVYKRSGAVVDDTPFFAKVSEGIQSACTEEGFHLRIQYIFQADFTEKDMTALRFSDCTGIILLGTEMMTNDLKPFFELPIPVVVLDSYFETFPCDTVLINNEQGAYIAARHLFQRCKAQPGYLKSSYRINNFQEREAGLKKFIRAHGMSYSQSVIHELPPSIDGAYSDMKEILRRKEPLARCYFADNDLIAAGAVKAFREAGKRIPEDIAVVGFDNIPVSRILDLTTINVPKEYMGYLAARRLFERMKNPRLPAVKTAVETALTDRYTC